jgi:very-short-patch-repair endonuclease
MLNQRDMPPPVVSLSPAEGERVRVKGIRRRRTAEARDFARQLRLQSTDAEKRLWNLLRDRARDENRNRFLAGQDIKVLRFWNHQVRREADSVRFEIWHSLMERMGREKEIAGFLAKPGTPHLNPLPSEGRGGRPQVG